MQRIITDFNQIPSRFASDSDSEDDCDRPFKRRKATYKVGYVK